MLLNRSIFQFDVNTRARESELIIEAARHEGFILALNHAFHMRWCRDLNHLAIPKPILRRAREFALAVFIVLAGLT